jgi:hypothetical protein
LVGHALVAGCRGWRYARKALTVNAPLEKSAGLLTLMSGEREWTSSCQPGVERG